MELRRKSYQYSGISYSELRNIREQALLVYVLVKIDCELYAFLPDKYLSEVCSGQKIGRRCQVLNPRQRQRQVRLLQYHPNINLTFQNTA